MRGFGRSYKPVVTERPLGNLTLEEVSATATIGHYDVIIIGMHAGRGLPGPSQVS